MRFGFTPDEVDEWPIVWSQGWLLERVLEYEHDPEKWKGQPIGFSESSGAGMTEPPAGWEQLPMIEEVSDGE